ncbi:MAG: DNRLRE domain-containing protein [Bacteroidetes bacterium]|nr:DNRLRE domain-containing protein [Bacteroidota bacterium]
MKTKFKIFLFLPLLFSVFCIESCTKEIQNYINNNLTPPAVDAGSPRIITAPVSFDTLVGTVISYNGPIRGYLWSLISGPGIPSIESPSSRTTRVSNLVPGVYKFQFAAIDSAGLTGVDTTSITVKSDPNPIKTLIVQPTNNTDEAHVMLVGTSNWTDPGAPEFNASAWTVSGNLSYSRGFFKFNLSTIPANATILSAKLTLYSTPTPLNGNLIDANSGSANAMFIERITSNWSASTVNWSNQPGTDVSTQILIPHTNLSFFDLVDVDVKSLVAPMVSTNNYGFKIRLQNETAYNIRNFCSSKYSDAAKHPKLVITYQ